MTRTKKLILALVLLALIGTGVYYYLNSEYLNANVDRHDNNIETVDQANSIDYGPPTEEQQNETGSNKNQSSENSEDSAANNKEDVDVVLTRASVGEDLVTVTGYVDIDVAGNCTATLTSNSNTKEYTEPTQQDPANPENVNCVGFRIPKSDLSAAKSWTVQLSYNSGEYSGVSQNTMEINL